MQINFPFLWFSIFHIIFGIQYSTVDVQNLVDHPVRSSNSRTSAAVLYKPFQLRAIWQRSVDPIATNCLLIFFHYSALSQLNIIYREINKWKKIRTRPFISCLELTIFEALDWSHLLKKILKQLSTVSTNFFIVKWEIIFHKKVESWIS